MSDGPISESDPHLAAALLANGWGREDLAWERLSEKAMEADIAGDGALAAEHWAQALRCGRRYFARPDPRLATSLCNHAVGLRRAGDESVAVRLFEEAIEAWNAAPQWVQCMQLDRLAGSSVFHLRLERRHGDLYSRRQREQWLALAQEARSYASALAEGKADGTKRLECWRAQRPQGFTDSRKLLAAVWLLAPRA